MKASDYIVEYLIEKGITDVFGYPGGMVTHLMDSFSKFSDQISAHVLYHEQGCAFAACGYAQATGKTGVAYATSGPGATNLITGICDAYFDSIPTVFLTGQVNTFEMKDGLGVRQRGFQETDIVSMVKPVTKFAETITDASMLRWYLDKAFYVANDGRKGPVLLDIPMDISRAEIDSLSMEAYQPEKTENTANIDVISEKLNTSDRPVLLLGNGIKEAGCVELCKKAIKSCCIPTVTTMLAVDLAGASNHNYGFVGAYGTRSANFVLAKADLVISIGARLDIRQVGAIRKNFAPDAQIIRIDVDDKELGYKIHDNDAAVHANVKDALEVINSFPEKDYSSWIDICDEIKKSLKGIDDRNPNKLINKLSYLTEDDSIITTDVGQNQVWVAQSFKFKENQQALFSGGHGAMGYSLPAAIGAAIGTKKKVYCFCGDGGLQMNIQEFQTAVREKLPIKIILMNNEALGMIRHFQEMYFADNYTQTVPEGGYTVPDFGAVAKAYGLEYAEVNSLEDITNNLLSDNKPSLVEVHLREKTYVVPKLKYKNPNQDQEPQIDRDLYNRLMSLKVSDVKKEVDMTKNMFGGGQRKAVNSTVLIAFPSFTQPHFPVLREVA